MHALVVVVGFFFCGSGMYFPDMKDGNGTERSIAMRSDRK